MPNFDGGHYFLTALIPLRTQPMRDGPGVFTSPVHALRKLLAQLPASPTLRFKTPASPFANVPGLHFARLVIVDDVAYNGRVGEDAIFGRIKGFLRIGSADPLVPQTQDHLPRPYLMLAMDFDAPDGRDLSRDTFLKAMWDVMSADIASVLQYAVGFDKMRPDGNGFATYIAACQIDTTMSFNDYYIDKLDAKAWYLSAPLRPYVIAGGATMLSIAFGLVEALFFPGWRLLGLVFLFVGIALIPVLISRIGNCAFPTDPRTSLPNVLKALSLQRAFTAFAIENQRNVPNEAALHAAFGDFLAIHKPDELAQPTQESGVLGI